MQVGIKYKKVQNIPVIDVYDIDATDKKPIIIILHGFTCCKELQIKEAYRFVQHGFLVTLFDAYQHGEIQDEAFKKLSYFEKMSQGTNIAQETMKYIDRLIDDHCRTYIADPDRIGLFGISMGGSIIYKYIATQMRPNIKAAIPVISTPLLGDSLKELTGKDPEAAKYLNDEVLGEIKRMDAEPYSNLIQLNNFPLLMLNSDNDPIIPIELVCKSYTEMSRNYTDKEKITLIEYTGIGHEVTEDMIEQACVWFEKYL
jgi:alpha-beta hydrolase superfamily lysophospholipase